MSLHNNLECHEDIPLRMVLNYGALGHNIKEVKVRYARTTLT